VAQLEIRQVSYQDSVSRTLVEAAMAELAGRYGGTGDDTAVDPADFSPPDGDFLVAFLDGYPWPAAAGVRTVRTARSPR
jgi:hypothetical protein